LGTLGPSSINLGRSWAGTPSGWSKLHQHRGNSFHATTSYWVVSKTDKAPVSQNLEEEGRIIVNVCECVCVLVLRMEHKISCILSRCSTTGLSPILENKQF
jgi:hypothetical protein